MGDIVTFYSYKGGTGRSMALANVGHILAWQFPQPRKVLMIDWDLEAPGLHRYFYNQLKTNFSVTAAEKYPGLLEAAPGLIDFLQGAATFYAKEYTAGDLGVTHAETDDARAAFARLLIAYPLSRYILSVAPPDTAPAPDAARGLHLMKAGNQSSSGYANSIRTLDWQRFYNDYGSFFTLLREHLAAEYDMVLIDSRTGLTDIGDICVRVMPAKLVGVFVPNEQNLEGLIQVMKGAAEYRMKSRDPRGLLIYPLASRIDAGRSLLRDTWWKGGLFRDRRIAGYEPRFESVAKSVYQLDTCDLEAFFDSTQLPYDSDYAFGEEVAARDGSSGRLTISYSCANLARYLVEDRVPWESLTDKLAETGLPSDQPADELLVVQRLNRYLLPLVFGMLGLLLTIFAPAIQSGLWGVLQGPVNPVQIGKDFEATPFPAIVAGFGLDTAKIYVRETGNPLISDVSVRALTGRGEIVAEPLSILANVFRVELRSEGLGREEVEVIVFSSSPKPGNNSFDRSVERGTVQIFYAWPVALTAGVIGGTFLGLSFLLIRMLASPFRRPSLLSILALCIQSFVFSLIVVLGYLAVFAPAVVEPLRYSMPLIELLAAMAPVVLDLFASQFITRLLSRTASK